MSPEPSNTTKSIQKNHPHSDEDEIVGLKGPALYKEIGVLIIGCVGLFFGAKWFVNGAIVAAQFFHVDNAIIGLTVVALGTSLPELVTSVIAAYHKNTDLAIGNLLGSCIFNILSILGFTSLIQNISVVDSIVRIDILWMIGITMLLLPLMLIRRKIGKVEGVILLCVYFSYIYFLIERGISMSI